jgi:uncharacterized protein GlcG (DUF336 family)
MKSWALIAFAIPAILVAAPASAQQQPAAPAAPVYGEPITVDQAKKAAEAAVSEAKKNNWMMVISIVGPYGDLVYLEKMDNAQTGSITISQHKARAAAAFRRPTKSYEERVAAGGAGLTALTLDGVVASEGGIPIVLGGKIIGAIGVSGATSAQDGQVASAGVNALN